MHTSEWYVITGAPCSGKTTVIHSLEQLGYTVVHEVARSYIDEKLKKGLSIEQITSDTLNFESTIMNKKLEIESFLGKSKTVFYSRLVNPTLKYI